MFYLYCVFREISINTLKKVVNLEIPRVEGFKSQEFLKENESSNQKKLSKGGV